MKKFIVLISVVMALGALAVPAGALAWTMGGKALAETGELTGEGSASFTGGTNCTSGVEATLDLTAGTEDGHITKFAPTNLAACDVTETLKSLGCTALASSTANNLPWTATENIPAGKIEVTGVKLTNTYTGGAFCPKTVTLEQLSGEKVTATPDSVTAATQLTLSGTLHTSLGTTSTIGGVIKATKNSGTYGL
jgi:hypothetical protein